MPKIQESAISSLHPTQLTVGMIEVQDKKTHLASLKPQGQQDFMQAHPMPAVIGPGGKLYITDHHHLGRAAFEAGVTTGFFLVEADLSSRGPDDFWQEMDRNLWVHPLDQNGVRHYYAAIPQHLEKLVDDVYRSLAGYVRNAGGFDKTPTAFAEFVWADFFRRSIPIEDVTADFHAAVRVALSLAQGKLARGLPGYTGK
ncbi:MAG: ParB-like protein [Thiobacillaceae bacterium]